MAGCRAMPPWVRQVDAHFGFRFGELPWETAAQRLPPCGVS